jgi:hypothetical protein
MLENNNNRGLCAVEISTTAAFSSVRVGRLAQLLIQAKWGIYYLIYVSFTPVPILASPQALQQRCTGGSESFYKSRGIFQGSGAASATAAVQLERKCLICRQLVETVLLCQIIGVIEAAVACR